MSRCTANSPRHGVIMKNEIVDKVEKSIKASGLRDSKFQQANRPSDKVFNPTANFRKTHLSAKLSYVADIQKTDDSEIVALCKWYNAIASHTIDFIATEFNVSFDYVRRLVLEHIEYISHD